MVYLQELFDKQRNPRRDICTKSLLKRDFIAQHYLFGGDWGAENQLHAHHYVIELQLEGAVSTIMGILWILSISRPTWKPWWIRFETRPSMICLLSKGLNPSIEHFSRVILCLELDRRIQAANITSLCVVLWENEIAWASLPTRAASSS